MTDTAITVVLDNSPTINVDITETTITVVEASAVPEAIVTPLMGPQGLQGVQGEPGEQGPQGEPGSGGTDAEYIHTQLVPDTVWVIVHNMNRYFSVAVVDSSGSVVVGDVHYDSSNQITVTFGAAFAGLAYLS